MNYKDVVMFKYYVERDILKTNLYTLSFGRNVNSWGLLILIHNFPVNLWNDTRSLISNHNTINYNYSYNVRYDFNKIFKSMKIGWTKCIEPIKTKCVDNELNNWKQDILWNRSLETFIPISKFIFPLDITNYIIGFI